MKVIYLDVLVFVNLIVNFSLLCATKKICRQSCGTIRMILSDLFCSICSFMIFLPNFGAVFDVLIRLFVSSAAVIIAFGFRNIKRFLNLLGGFFSVSFAYGGICFALWYVFKIPGIVIRNSIIYFDLSPIVLIASSAVCYVVLMVLKKHFQSKNNNRLFYTVEITVNDISECFKGFFDTGNMLYDCFSECPVIIVKRSCLKNLSKILPEALLEKSIIKDEALKQENYALSKGFNSITDDRNTTAVSDQKTKYNDLKGFRLIPYSVVGSKGLLPAIRADRVIIYDIHKSYIPDRCLLAVTDEKDGDWEVLLGNNIFERSICRDRIVKKNTF